MLQTKFSHSLDLVRFGFPYSQIASSQIDDKIVIQIVILLCYVHPYI